MKGSDGTLHTVAVDVRRRALWSQESGEAGRSGVGRVFILEFAVDVRAVAKGRFRNKSLAL